jgi:hypothetical protein
MIRNWRLLGGFGLAIAATITLSAPSARAQDAAGGKSFSYTPPSRSAPAGRVGGSTRGSPQSDFVVEVLTPENHVGLSAVDQPVLYWYVSKPVNKLVEISIDTDEPTAAPPLLETTLRKSWPAGISGLSLRDLGVRLKPGVTYRWSVAVVVDPAQRSSDVTATGMIQHVRPASGTIPSEPEAAARISAQQGYWYDALAALSRDADRRPDRRAMRADMLDQVGLKVPAAFDRQAGRSVSAQ